MPLDNLQHYFARTITKAPTEEYKFYNAKIEEEAKEYIVANHMRAHERMEIYHQQYWWRLLLILQKDFPLVTRMFGVDAFTKQIAIPYLLEYPPSTWSLYELGKNLPRFVKEHYREKDKKFVTLITKIDWAINESFWIGEEDPLDAITLEEKITLQPHIHLFRLQADLFAFREEVVQEESNHYNTNPYPEITYGTFFYVVYRNREKCIVHEKISEAEYTILSNLKKGTTLQHLFNTSSFTKEVEDKIAEWFAKWTNFCWLKKICFAKKPKKITLRLTTN